MENAQLLDPGSWDLFGILLHLQSLAASETLESSLTRDYRICCILGLDLCCILQFSS
jgi:hypothetical protein